MLGRAFWALGLQPVETASQKVGSLRRGALGLPVIRARVAGYDNSKDNKPYNNGADDKEFKEKDYRYAEQEPGCRGFFAVGLGEFSDSFNLA